MSEVIAINMFTLRPDVPLADFARFSEQQDRPVCLSKEVVTSFDAYVVEDDAGARPRIVEVMGLTSWPEWTEALAVDADLAPVVRRFGELVDTDTVTTLLVRPLTATPPEGEPA
ncbi:hypothetical protein [Amycolatopsis pigmentata]|uniref:REDY-like protein HapK n=1 Tax=Amycolatopsis pigmentata TaxID=450801 RepID=A0ABW5FQB6_9PSEU